MEKYTAAIVLLLASLMTNMDFAYGEDSGTLSESCTADLIEISTNTNITSLYPNASCTIEYESGETECTADFNEQSGVGAYRDACFAAGGQYYTEDLAYNCLFVTTFDAYNLTYRFKSSPDCVGASCTDSELTAYITNELYPFYANEFEKNGFIQCVLTGTNMMTYDAAEVPAPISPVPAPTSPVLPAAPTSSAPVPTSSAPVPTSSVSAPTFFPAPTASAPMTSAPAPTTSAPAPTASAPAPTTSAPAPTASAPAPISTVPTPTVPVPAPTTVSTPVMASNPMVAPIGTSPSNTTSDTGYRMNNSGNIKSVLMMMGSVVIVLTAF